MVQFQLPYLHDVFGPLQNLIDKVPEHILRCLKYGSIQKSWLDASTYSIRIERLISLFNLTHLDKKYTYMPLTSGEPSREPAKGMSYGVLLRLHKGSLSGIK